MRLKLWHQLAVMIVTFPLVTFLFRWNMLVGCAVIVGLFALNDLAVRKSRKGAEG